MKPGELERNLSRLVEVARTARERLAAIERELAELRLEMERLAAQSGEAAQPAAASSETGRAEPGSAPAPREVGSE